MNLEEFKKSAIAKWLAAAVVAAIGAFVGIEYVQAQEVVVVEVPEGMKVVVVDENMPDFCVSVEGWKVEENKEECDKGELQVSPGCRDD